MLEKTTDFFDEPAEILKIETAVTRMFADWVKRNCEAHEKILEKTTKIKSGPSTYSIFKIRWTNTTGTGKSSARIIPLRLYTKKNAGIWN